MAAIVFVWNEDILNKHPGHVSLNIEGKVYVSYYPDPKANPADALFKGVPSLATRNAPRRHGANGHGPAQLVMSATMAVDTHNFKRMPNFASAPIVGLDEAKMAQWWLAHRTDRYSLLRNSCAHMVVQTLDVGGAGDRSIIAKGIIAASKFNYVLPRDCIYLAKSIAVNQN
jgi:hypothetical protein